MALTGSGHKNPCPPARHPHRPHVSEPIIIQSWVTLPISSWFGPEPHLCEPLLVVRFNRFVCGFALGPLRWTRANVRKRLQTRLTIHSVAVGAELSHQLTEEELSSIAGNDQCASLVPRQLEAHR